MQPPNLRESGVTSVFLSYDHEDAALAAPIAAALERAGHSVWWDRHIHGGAEFQTEIENAVQQADAVVVLWSGRSIKSAWVRDEAAEGRDQGKLVPVLLEPVKPPMGFRQYQTIDLSDRRRASGVAQLDELLRAVTKMSAAAPSQLSASPAVLKQGIDRRAVLAGGAVAAAAVAGVGGWLWLKPKSAGASDSIAVLPFANLSGDRAQASFADGIAGEIRNILTRVAGLRVAGSMSSAAVRADDARTAARKLGVTNILTGNVRQTASTIRITAELIDGKTGLAKWSQNYDRAPGDVIRIQTDIAEKVTRALAVALGASARKALAAETSSIAAQTLAFQARDLSWQYTVPAFQRCLQLVDQAIALDPNYGRAYALKAFFVNNLASQVATTPAELAKARAEALRYAKTAVAKAPDLPIARSGLGFAYALTLQVSKSLREHEIAISLPGSEPDVLRNYGYAMSSSAKPDLALRFVDESLALDPLNAGAHRAHASILFNARRYEEVVRYARKLKQESPELYNFEHLLGRALLMLDRTKEAAPAIGESLSGLALLAARTGNRDLARAKLAALRQRDGDMANFLYAAIHAQLGEKEAAFAALERAWAVRDSYLLDVKVNPFLDPLRSDARYTALVTKVGFPA
jgi:TolB-like protein